MSDTHLQLSLFGGAPRVVTPDPLPVDLPVEPEELVVPEGQLGLFEGLAAHCTRVALLARAGQFDEAYAEAERVAANHEEAVPWCSAFDRLLRSVETTRGSPDDLAALAERWARDKESRDLPESLSLGILRGLHLATARAAEQKGPGTTAGGRLAGWHWLQAGRAEDGRRSLESAVGAGQNVGAALVLLGNLAHREGDAAQARESYRRAFLLDPTGVRLEEVTDDGVRELAEEAAELELLPAEAWVPIVGLCAGVFNNGVEKSVIESVAQFQSLLGRSRQATLRGVPDVTVRRELKSLAPNLFPQLRDSGLI